MAAEYVPYDGPIVTRSEAAKLGLLRYFTGIPCRHGHVSERYVSVRGCCSCGHNPSRQASDEKYRSANREAIRAKVALWRASDPEKARAFAKRTREANRDAIRARKQAAYATRKAENQKERRARYAKDPEKYLAINAAWAAANPEKVAAVKRNRKARKKQSQGSHTADDIKSLWRLQRGRCASDWCRADLSVGHHVDHIKPLSRGGSNDKSNIQLLCVPCNLGKHAKDPIEWAQEHGRLL